MSDYMKPEQFIDLIDREAKRHLEQTGANIGDGIAWTYIKNLVQNYRNMNRGTHG